MCVGNEFCKSVLIEKSLVPEISKIREDYTVAQLVIEPSRKDALAEFTYQTKEYFRGLKAVFEHTKSWKYYRMIRGKSQPAHLLTALSVLLVAKLFHTNTGDSKHLSSESGLAKLVYLGCFAAHFGAQIWMTFISGLALYFNLPRHTFGSVQKILFPKYFSLNSMLSLATVYTFAKSQTSDNQVQLVFLVLCFFIELIIRLYLTPILVKLMVAKNVIEQKAGIGSEVGKYLPGYLVKCPQYLRIHTSFRKVHMTIAIGNMMTMGFTCAHLYYLSTRLCI